MGSRSSKDASSSTSSAVQPSASEVRRKRSKGARVLQNSCLGMSSGPYDSDVDEQSSYHRDKENGRLNNEACTDQTAMGSNPVERELCRKFKAQQQQPHNGVRCISSDSELDGWGQKIATDTVSRSGSSSSRVVSSRSLNSSSRFRSRFNFFPRNLSFRLSRAASLGSSRSYPLFSTSPTISNSEERRTSRVLRLDSSASGRSVHLQDDEIVSTQDVIRNNENTGIQAEVNLVSPRNRTDLESIETRRPERRFGAREPVERSVRFSRTLSVGRLRDRVLRRSSFSDGLFGRLQEDRVVTDSSQGSGRQAWDGATSSDGNVETAPTSSSNLLSSMSSSRVNSQDHEVDNLRPREARYHDILDHRTDFLERRRRIRSQVRALQRLGSRFENLSGHERSCILSGQHRTGHCTCRMSNRAANPDDDSSARASISRIVMLAEALFEVLDEIHQQSVVLSSRPSMSSIGSVPAPKEVVESIPVKIYMTSQKQLNEEAAQCYICLVEYEEGDCMRILPCHHEFHRTCVDKWLKEIHRVCPLCRGDVCRSDSLPLPVDN
ncbi:hypothetical protein NE237_029612 [Protea cynaroides]|uniref:RING-type domain-containing protein n=1 Tax=Protea cynaroides TaxID=273540 RepID=A0A9Q0GUK8_9MAGN|nr:hypothetical protein NE237_029612 [Protea cynaroides]